MIVIIVTISLTLIFEQVIYHVQYIEKLTLFPSLFLQLDLSRSVFASCDIAVSYNFSKALKFSEILLSQTLSVVQVNLNDYAEMFR